MVHSQNPCLWRRLQKPVSRADLDQPQSVWRDWGCVYCSGLQGKWTETPPSEAVRLQGGIKKALKAFWREEWLKMHKQGGSVILHSLERMGWSHRCPYCFYCRKEAGGAVGKRVTKVSWKYSSSWWHLFKNLKHHTFSSVLLVHIILQAMSKFPKHSAGFATLSTESTHGLAFLKINKLIQSPLSQDSSLIAETHLPKQLGISKSSTVSNTESALTWNPYGNMTTVSCPLAEQRKGSHIKSFF